MMEQHSFSSDFDNRYKFNGKELDVEMKSIHRTPIKNKSMVR